MINPQKEIDTSEFKWLDFHSKVTNRRLRNDLDKELYKLMERSMTGCNKTFIYLTNNDIKWKKAERIILYARKPNNKRRSNAKEWPQPPTLDEVLKCLNETCGSCEIDSELLDDVQIMFDGKSKLLKDFIFTRFDFGEIGTYIYYYGTWLEMTADYLYLTETDFTQLLPDNFMKAKQ